MGAMHGRITIGMLIMQDILAVLFLTFSTGKVPTLYAIPLLLALLFGRKCLSALISRSGHGEMIALCGLFLALVVGAESFEVVGLKADLVLCLSACWWARIRRRRSLVSLCWG